jgi:hypothetical protein
MKFVVGLLLGLVVGCASSIGDSLLRFQDREFVVHPDKPAMGYPYKHKVCKPRSGLGRVLGDKCSMEWTEEVYDFNDKPTRQRFIDASCTMTCAGRFQY